MAIFVAHQTFVASFLNVAFGIVMTRICIYCLPIESLQLKSMYGSLQETCQCTCHFINQLLSIILLHVEMLWRCCKVKGAVNVKAPWNLELFCCIHFVLMLCCFLNFLLIFFIGIVNIVSLLYIICKRIFSFCFFVLYYWISGC